MQKTKLLILPSLLFGLAPDRRVRMTEKFISGVTMTAARWPGPVAVLAPEDPFDASGNLDDVWVDPAELPFEVMVDSFDGERARAAISGAAVVLGGADHRLNHLPQLCRSLGIPYVFLTEYSLKTRWQIIDAERLNPLVAWRRKIWAWQQERANIAAAKTSAAVHCNGTPTYDAYRPLNPNTLLYFDSRVEPAMLPSSPRLAARIASGASAEPIRLAFSGRLNAMKGADHLLLVADALRALGVDFTLDIYGDGPLVAAMKDTMAQKGLDAQVRLGGVLDFATELMPRIRDTVDLFVCCHRQGDPSCTYLETWACGVPIVGYANEAFEGLVRRCPAGISVPMNDPGAMAAAVAALARDPHRLLELARHGLEFARQHTFEREFAARIDHMTSLIGQGLPPERSST
ncbi:MAG: glycosyltransferase [Hydrogenophaga sp.]